MINKNLDELLIASMHPENSEIEKPEAELVVAARQMIGLRKRQLTERSNLLQNFMQFFKLDLRVYPVGISVLLLFGLVLFLREQHYSNHNGTVISQAESMLSLKNSTISVNSNTMLTSTPTGLRN